MSNIPKIVHVEDEGAIVSLMRDAMKILRIDVDIIETNNVADGMAAVRAHNPDLVLLDLMLPGRNGWELVDEIRAEEAYKDLPIIVLTVRPPDEERMQGGRVDEVQEFITKPFSVLQLGEAIQKYVKPEN